MKRLASRILWSLIGLVILAAIVWAFLPKPVQVDLGAVRRGPLQVTVDHEGKTRIKERYVVSAPLGGWLQRIPWKAGARVEAGKTLLAVIEPSDPALLDARTIAQTEARVKAAEAAKAQSTANLDRARAAEKLAKSDLQRAKKLIAQGAMSQQAFDAAQEKARAAIETVNAAQFSTRIADFELEQAQAALMRVRPKTSDKSESGAFDIVSPVFGRVLRVLQESATAVAPGQPLIEVGDPTNLEIVVDVLSSDAVKVRPGAKMLIEHWGGDQPLLARVRLVEPAGFMKVSALGVEEQHVNVIGDFVSPLERWRGLGDAYRVEARIVTWEGQNILQVPSSALFRSDEGGWAVFRVADGRAHACSVKIGHSNGLESQVLEGLKAGDQVIVHPGDKVKAGVRVTSR